MGRHNSTTEKQGTTTKEPQTFGEAELYYRGAESNNQSRAEQSRVEQSRAEQSSVE